MEGCALVTTADAVATSPSARRLVVAAERLFALHGIDGVSLRQIAAEAGSANNSAVHYHFGSKKGLITAIFRHRLPQLINERRLLAARCDPGDLRSRFEAHYLPVLVLAESSDNNYVSFVEQLQRQEVAFGPYLTDLPEEGRRSNDEFRRDLQDLLGHLDETLRELRIAEAQALFLHAAADRERAVASRADAPSFELFVSSLLDGITGFLSVPASEDTLRRWRGISDAAPHRLRLL
jgi:AcrR family transcriptional regulator